MTLYIDYFSVVPDRKTQKYHGGGNYAKDIIFRLYNEIKNVRKLNIDFEILCPKHYEMSKINEPILSSLELKWCVVDSVEEYIKDKEGVLYYPVLYEYADFHAIKKIKKNNTKLKIFATVHDMRMYDFYNDYTEKYYFKKNRRLMFVIYKYIFEWFRPKFERNTIRKALMSLDYINTDSNYSMQAVLDICPSAKIFVYYIPYNVSENNIIENTEYEYMLFVSGARRIKNLGRVLIAFSLFKKKYNSDIKLVITGITTDRLKTICEMKKIDKDIVEQDVIYYDYVSPETLSELYDGCRFVVYLSKAEGFGLPILEAAQYGKVCLASNVTSIPEVMGGAVKFVNPLDENGIADAMGDLCDDMNLTKYQERVKKMLKIANNRIEIEQQFFLDDFIYNIYN